MANNSLSDIRAEIATILGTVTQVQAIAHGHTQNYTGYPFVKIWFNGAQPIDRLETGKGHKRVYVFALEVVQDASKKSRAVAEANYQDCIEAILDKFQDTWTLNDDCDLATTGEVTPLFRDTGQGIQASAIINLEVTVYKDVS